MEEKKENLNVVFSPEKAEKSPEKKSFWHINRKLIPYKLHYFLFSAGGGAVFPFNSAFGITVLGLTASNIAACFTIQQITLFVLKPGIGYVTDYLNKLKTVIVVLAVLKTVFFFLMFNIPNSGMPGIHTIPFTNTSQNNTYCQLCFISDVFDLDSRKEYPVGENFAQILSCFNSNIIGNVLINCSSEYIKPTNSCNSNFQIWKTTCNLPLKYSSLSKQNTALEDAHANEDVSDILYIKNSQFSSLCLFPIGRLHYSMNFSSHDFKHYCYALNKESIMRLQYFLLKSDFISIDCNGPHKDISLQQKDEHDIGVENFKTYQFWAFVICAVLISSFGSSEFTMADTACYESMKGIDFGQQRVFSAIGWGLTAPLAGFLNDFTESYMAAWCILAGLSVLQIWNSCRMDLVKPDFSHNTLNDMRAIFSSMEFLCFAAGTFLNGMFFGTIVYYLPWFIVSIGGNKLIIGLVHTIQCFFGEVPVFYFSGWLLKKLGHFNLVSLGLICHGIRFFCYSYLHNPWWVLPIECLQGFTYGSFIPAMTSYAKLNSKPGTEATMQSILCTIYEALGWGLGCLVSGVCIEHFGGHSTFFYLSFFCVIATLVNILSTLIIRHRKSSQDVTKSAASEERY